MCINRSNSFTVIIDFLRMISGLLRMRRCLETRSIRRGGLARVRCGQSSSRNVDRDAMIALRSPDSGWTRPSAACEREHRDRTPELPLDCRSTDPTGGNRRRAGLRLWRFWRCSHSAVSIDVIRDRPISSRSPWENAYSMPTLSSSPGIPRCPPKRCSRRSCRG